MREFAGYLGYLNTQRMFVCTICNLFAGKSFPAVLRHMGNHRFDPDLHIKCGINSCTEVYKNFESFRYRKHREVLHSSTMPSGECSAIIPLNFEDQAEDSGSEEEGVDEIPCDLKRLNAMFILKTYEERRVTQTAITGIIRDIKGLWRENIAYLKVFLLKHSVSFL